MSSPRTFLAGTRGSDLALWQTRTFSRLLRESFPAGQCPTLVEQIVTTRGDLDQVSRPSGRLDKGMFTEALETRLLSKEIDWAVHSLKDLPTRWPDGLAVVAMLPRAPVHDLLLVHPECLAGDGDGDGNNVLPLKSGTVVGTSSLRREALLQCFAPGARAQVLRGNVPTRVEKLRRREAGLGAILLARAGIERLGLSLEGVRAFALAPEHWVPAAGQGAVAAQCRADDAEMQTLLGRVHDPGTERAVTLERDALRVLEGGCTAPFGAWFDGETLHLGLSDAGHWRSLKVPVTERLFGTERESLLAASLAALKAQAPTTLPRKASDVFYKALAL